MSIIDITTDIRRRKLEALEQARRRYLQMLYGYLPCLSMPDEAGLAHSAITLIKSIAEWHEAALFGNGPKKSDEPALPLARGEEAEPLSEGERMELAGLVAKYQIFVARDPDTQEMTMTHPFIVGAFHPLNDREVLEVARDIAVQAGGGE